MSPSPPLASRAVPSPPTFPSPPHPLEWSQPTIPLLLDSLPPLPPLRDTAIARLALLHKSKGSNEIVPRTDYEAELDSYRRLEWWGDAKLNELVSRELLRRFP